MLVITTTLFLSGCIDVSNNNDDTTDVCFEQQLYKNTQGGRYEDFNEVVFPSCAVQSGNNIEVVLTSIMDSIEMVWYDAGDGTFDSYVPGQPHNLIQISH